jgi:hypothetical protein
LSQELSFSSFSSNNLFADHFHTLLVSMHDTESNCVLARELYNISAKLPRNETGDLMRLQHLVTRLYSAQRDDNYHDINKVECKCVALSTASSCAILLYKVFIRCHGLQDLIYYMQSNDAEIQAWSVRAFWQCSQLKYIASKCRFSSENIGDSAENALATRNDLISRLPFSYHIETMSKKKPLPGQVIDALFEIMLGKFSPYKELDALKSPTAKARGVQVLAKLIKDGNVLPILLHALTKADAKPCERGLQNFVLLLNDSRNFTPFATASGWQHWLFPLLLEGTQVARLHLNNEISVAESVSGFASAGEQLQSLEQTNVSIFNLSMSVITSLHYFCLTRPVKKLRPKANIMSQTLDLLIEFTGWTNDSCLLFRLMLICLINNIKSRPRDFTGNFGFDKQDLLFVWDNLYCLLLAVEEFVFFRPVQGSRGGAGSVVGMGNSGVDEDEEARFGLHFEDSESNLLGQRAAHRATASITSRNELIEEEDESGEGSDDDEMEKGRSSDIPLIDKLLELLNILRIAPPESQSIDSYIKNDANLTGLRKEEKQLKKKGAEEAEFWREARDKLKELAAAYMIEDNTQRLKAWNRLVEFLAKRQEKSSGGFISNIKIPRHKNIKVPEAALGENDSSVSDSRNVRTKTIRRTGSLGIKSNKESTPSGQERKLSVLVNEMSAASGSGLPAMPSLSGAEASPSSSLPTKAASNFSTSHLYLEVEIIDLDQQSQPPPPPLISPPMSPPPTTPPPPMVSPAAEEEERGKEILNRVKRNSIITPLTVLGFEDEPISPRIDSSRANLATTAATPNSINNNSNNTLGLNHSGSSQSIEEVLRRISVTNYEGVTSPALPHIGWIDKSQSAGPPRGSSRYDTDVYRSRAAVKSVDLTGLSPLSPKSFAATLQEKVADIDAVMASVLAAAEEERTAAAAEEQSRELKVNTIDENNRTPEQDITYLSLNTNSCCVHCGKTLREEIEMFMKNSAVYCKEDYDRLFGECKACEQLIEESEHHTFGSWLFHANCAACYACQRPFRRELASSEDVIALGATDPINAGIPSPSATDAVRIYEKDSSYYCYYDYYRIYGQKCGSCHEVIIGDCVEFAGNSFHIEHFHCSHCNKDLTALELDEDEEENESDSEDDEEHKSKFKTSKEKEQPYYFHEATSKLYCLEDYKRIFAKEISCFKCNQIALTNSCWLDVTGGLPKKLSHLACVHCSKCKLSAKSEPYTNFIVNNDTMWCKPDYRLQQEEASKNLNVKLLPTRAAPKRPGASPGATSVSVSPPSSSNNSVAGSTTGSLVAPISSLLSDRRSSFNQTGELLSTPSRSHSGSLSLNPSSPSSPVPSRPPPKRPDAAAPTPVRQTSLSVTNITNDNNTSSK